MKPHALTDRLGELHAGKENTHTYAFPLHTEMRELACMHCNRLNTHMGSEMNDDTMAKKSICSLSASLSPLSHTHTHTLISLLQCPRRPITQLHQAWKHIRWDAESDVHCRWQCAPSGRAAVLPLLRRG